MTDEERKALAEKDPEAFERETFREVLKGLQSISLDLDGLRRDGWPRGLYTDCHSDCHDSKIE